MPGRVMHETVGSISGLIAAASRAAELPQPGLALEAFGGFWGGGLGGALPDVLEPATWPGHRQFAHSATALAGLLVGADSQLGALQHRLRATATTFELRALEAHGDALASLMWSFLAWTLRFLAGFAAGIVAGYTSHVVLDAFTPRGIGIV